MSITEPDMLSELYDNNPRIFESLYRHHQCLSIYVAYHLWVLLLSEEYMTKWHLINGLVQHVDIGVMHALSC